MRDETVIAQTKNWIINVVIGCNFCPFAGREIKRGSIHYKVLNTHQIKLVLEGLSAEFSYLDDNRDMETGLLILADGFKDFTSYLNLVDLAELFLKKEGYEGKYQIASFHPLYIFAGSKENDPSNYTNRSPYPILQLLRETSISKAIKEYPEIKKIPLQNISYTNLKGLVHMQTLLNDCRNTDK